MKDSGCCSNCHTPVETPDGVIDLDAEGLCDDCAARRERARIIAAEDAASLDHDHSMDG